MLFLVVHTIDGLVIYVWCLQRAGLINFVNIVRALLSMCRVSL